MSLLKDIRISKRMTQDEAAFVLGVSVRSYKSYENEEKMQKTLKYKYMTERLERHVPIDETHGVLTREEILRAVKRVLTQYEGEVRYAVLYGAYAKGKAGKRDAVELLVSTRVSGLRFRDMENRLRDEMRKRVTLTERAVLLRDDALLDEILMHGVRVY